MQLNNKIAIVTGAAKGLGKEIALALARKGAHIVIADVLDSLMDNLVNDIRDMNCKALAIRADVSKSVQVGAMIKEILNKF